MEAWKAEPRLKQSRAMLKIQPSPYRRKRESEGGLSPSIPFSNQ